MPLLARCDESLYADAATSAALVLLLKPAIEKTSGFRHDRELEIE
jgi:hypothetical protein